MKLFCSLMSALFFSQSVASAGSKETWRGQSITEFAASEAEEFGWVVINDGVMGGLSKGNMELMDGETMRFHGTLSTENNGGFSLLTSQTVKFDLSNDLGLLLKVKGDGRTYTARLVTDAKFRGMEVSFSADFETKDGEWIQVKVPFADFNGSFRGRDLPDEIFDPAKIQRVGFLIGDKKDAPFELEIDWVRTYGKGKGDITKTTEHSAGGSATVEPQKIIPTAVADGRFTVLKKALDAARLTTFFQWDNPLTVFAPTDEAFSKLPEGMLEDLLKPENREKLVSILSYHVVAGSTGLGDAINAKSAKTVQGDPVNIQFTNGKILINNATLINSDVECTDGIIHVIDAVLLPPSMKPVATN